MVVPGLDEGVSERDATPLQRCDRSKRQAEALRHVTERQSTQQIARQLAFRGAIKKHLEFVYSKLDE